MTDFVTWALDQLGVKVTHFWAWVILITGALSLVGSGIWGFIGIAKTLRGRQNHTKTNGDKSALAGDVRIITRPGIEGLTPSVRFTTEGKRGQSFNLRERPTALRFVTLGGRIVREGDLPVEIPCGNGKLVIKRFTDSGFLWDEEGTIGDRVQVEFYPLATSTS